MPPSDPDAVVDAIRRGGEDDNFRKTTADAGRRYAELCAGESRMLHDIVRICGEVHRRDSPV